MVVEFFEKFFPFQLFEIFFVLTAMSRKFEAYDTYFLLRAGAFNMRRLASTFFSPLTDRIMIARGLR